MYSCDELFMRPLECYFGVYFPRCCATREINTKITLSWAHKQFATRVHTFFYIYSTHLCVWLLIPATSLCICVELYGNHSKSHSTGAGRSNCIPQILCAVINFYCPWYVFLAQHPSIIHKEGALWHLKQASQIGISNCIQRYSVGCNY